MKVLTDFRADVFIFLEVSEFRTLSAARSDSW
jgi:hypothetical protein